MYVLLGDPGYPGQPGTSGESGQKGFHSARVTPRVHNIYVYTYIMNSW